MPPFTGARKVLEPLRDGTNASFSGSQPDFLQLCHDVPLEVVNLKDGNKIQQTTEPVSKDHYRQFIESWLRCYENPSMNNLRDHNGRTIWFKVQPLITFAPCTTPHMSYGIMIVGCYFLYRVKLVQWLPKVSQYIATEALVLYIMIGWKLLW